MARDSQLSFFYSFLILEFNPEKYYEHAQTFFAQVPAHGLKYLNIF